MGDLFIMRIRCTFLAGSAFVIILAGCATQVDYGDFIPRSQMPYVVQDQGTNYEILDHECVTALLRVELAISETRSGIYGQLQEKFPEDSELMAYVDGVKKHFKRVGEPRADSLMEFKRQLEAHGGEPYAYYLHYDQPVAVNESTNLAEGEHGILILSRGRVVSKLEEFYTYNYSGPELSVSRAVLGGP
jgi:hypothetical protein